MEEKMQLAILKVIKLHKLKIIDSLSLEQSTSTPVNHIVLDKELNNCISEAKGLIKKVLDKSGPFNQKYDTEQQMIGAFESYFGSIDTPLKKILNSYENIYNSNLEEIHITLALNLIKKMLVDYMLWLEIIENNILEVSTHDATLYMDIEKESELIESFEELEVGLNNDSESELSKTVTILGFFGLGLILGG